MPLSSIPSFLCLLLPLAEDLVVVVVVVVAVVVVFVVFLLLLLWLLLLLLLSFVVVVVFCCCCCCCCCLLLLLLLSFVVVVVVVTLKAANLRAAASLSARFAPARRFSIAASRLAVSFWADFGCLVAAADFARGPFGVVEVVLGGACVTDKRRRLAKPLASAVRARTVAAAALALVLGASGIDRKQKQKPKPKEKHKQTANANAKAKANSKSKTKRKQQTAKVWSIHMRETAFLPRFAFLFFSRNESYWLGNIKILKHAQFLCQF